MFNLSLGLNQNILLQIGWCLQDNFHFRYNGNFHRENFTLHGTVESPLHDTLHRLQNCAATDSSCRTENKVQSRQRENLQPRHVWPCEKRHFWSLSTNLPFSPSELLLSLSDSSQQLEGNGRKSYSLSIIYGLQKPEKCLSYF